MDIVLPGTGGMKPLKDRFLACAYIRHQGRAMLIDCGEATQVALAACGAKLSRIERILFTHAHADHVAGLPGLLLSLGNTGRKEPVEIAAPKGMLPVIEGLLRLCPVLPYSLRYREIDPDAPVAWQWNGLMIEPFALDHVMPCLGYRVSLARRPKFLPEKAAALGLPQKLWGQLHKGLPVEHEGRKVYPHQVTEGERQPCCICYATDTRPVAAIARYAAGCDLLICEGTHGGEEWQSLVEEYGHMLMRDAAALAKQAGAKELWLTHYSPAEKCPAEHADAVRAIFPDAVFAGDGQAKELW